MTLLWFNDDLGSESKKTNMVLLQNHFRVWRLPWSPSKDYRFKPCQQLTKLHWSQPMDQTFVHLLLSEFMGTISCYLRGFGVHDDASWRKLNTLEQVAVFAITTWAFGITVTLFTFGGMASALLWRLQSSFKFSAEQFIPCCYRWILRRIRWCGDRMVYVRRPFTASEGQ